MVVPKYEELSVKSLYHESMTDPLVSQYLPDKDYCATDYPERDYFFGILATLKYAYLTQIVDHAKLVRYN